MPVLISVYWLFSDMRCIVFLHQLKSQSCSHGKSLHGHMVTVLMWNAPATTGHRAATSDRCTSHTETLCLLGFLEIVLEAMQRQLWLQVCKCDTKINRLYALYTSKLLLLSDSCCLRCGVIKILLTLDIVLNSLIIFEEFDWCFLILMHTKFAQIPVVLVFVMTYFFGPGRVPKRYDGCCTCCSSYRGCCYPFSKNA